MSQFSVKFETASQKGAWDLLTDQNLIKVGIKREMIKEVTPVYEVPGSLYTEAGVASETHPCDGSVGIWIVTHDGLKASIQDIFYYDYNPQGSHSAGLRHWNHERRFIDKEGKEEIGKEGIEFHIIDDCDWINIGFEGREQRTVVRPEGSLQNQST